MFLSVFDDSKAFVSVVLIVCIVSDSLEAGYIGYLEWKLNVRRMKCENST